LAIVGLACRVLAAEPIKIGVMLATTGQLGSSGTEGLAGAQIFVEETNAKGGVNGRPLVLVHMDHQSKPELAVSGAKRLIQQDKVVGLIGPESTVVGAAISAVVNENKIPVVGCICYTGPITPYEFSVFPLHGLPENQVRFAKERNVSRLGIITQAGAQAEVVKRDHIPVFEREGLAVVAFEQFQPGDADLTPLLAKLRSKGAQQVYVAALGAPATMAPKNFKQLNFSGYFWTWPGNANQAFIEAVGEAGDVVNLGGTKILVYRDLPGSDPDKARLTEFARKYMVKTGREPGTHAGFGYDMMLSMANAIAKGGDNPQRIREALETQTGLLGMNGTINRSPKDHNGLTAYWINVRIDTKAKRFILPR
jgi:branched-chain amino acid transport system substrate-binding protein